MANNPREPALPRIDPEWLSSFLAVAEKGGVLAASRGLGISQPALSARIRRLEEALGKPVFSRSAQGMELTAAGRRLLPVARKLPKLVQEAIAAVDPEAVARMREPLRLAASTTLANFVFPNLIARFAAEHGLSGLELKVGNTEEVLAWVRGGRIALGVVEGLKRAAGLRLEPFDTDVIVPVFAPERVSRELMDRIDAVKGVADVAKLPILWRESGSGTRRVIEESFRSSGVAVSKLKSDYTIGGTVGLKAAAIAGLGIAFLPRGAVEQELLIKKLQVIDLDELRIERTFSWVLPSGELPTELNQFRRWADRQRR